MSLFKTLKFGIITAVAFASFSATAANYNLPNNNLPGCSKSGNTYTCPNGLNLNFRDRIQISGNNSVVINVNGNFNLGSEMRINENGSAQQLTITTTGSYNGGFQSVINANISSQQNITLANENTFSGSLVAANDLSVGFRTNVDGSIRSTSGSVILQGENSITGNVDARNNVIVRFLTEVNGNLNATNGNVILEGQNDVSGAIFSGGDTILRFWSDVNGDIEADGRVTLDGANRVDGNINAKDMVRISNSSAVTGYVNAPEIIGESNVQGETCNVNNNEGPCATSATRPLCENIWPIGFDDFNSVPLPFSLPGQPLESQLPRQLQPIDYLRRGDFGDVGADYLTNGHTSRVYIDGNLTIQSGRRINTNGSPDELILVVTGDLTLEDNVEFSGFIYVSGNLYFERGLFRPTEVTGGISVGGRAIDLGGFGSGPEVTYEVPDRPIEGGQFCRAQPTEPEEPVLKWRMNNGPWNGSTGEIVDDSGNDLDGVAVNNANWLPASNESALEVNDANMGTCGYGYFDKSRESYLEVNDSTVLDFTDEFTIGLWIKPESYPDSGLMTILSKDENYEFHLNPDGTINWWWRDSEGFIRELNSSVSVPLSEWSYVVIRYKNGEQTIFIKGDAVGNANFSGELQTNSDRLQVGADQGVAARYFDGFMDEVSIYDKALSLAQIENLEQERTQCQTQESVNHYRLEFNSPALTCTGAEITVKACSDASCSSLFSDTTSVGLSLTPAANSWSSNPLTFTGEASTRLQKYQPGNYPVSLSNSTPAAINPSRCFVNGEETADCSIQFNDTGFIFTDGPERSNRNIPKQTAGVPYNDLYLHVVELNPNTLACQSATSDLSQVQISRRCLNPNSCSNTTDHPQAIMNLATDLGNVDVPVNPDFATLATSFSNSQEKIIKVEYGDVGAVQLEAKATLPNGQELKGISESFVWQPHSIIDVQYSNLQESFADNEIIARAGTSISVTLASLNAYGSITPNFGNEQDPESLKLAEEVITGSADEIPGELIVSDPFETVESAQGERVYKSDEVIYKEVGIPTFKAIITSGDYLSGVHAPQSTPVHSFSPGRYIPDRFEVSATGFLNRCDEGRNNFFYIEQKQKLQTATRFEAVNAMGEVTKNYDSSLLYVQDDFALEFYAFNQDSATDAPTPDNSQLKMKNPEDTEDSTSLVWSDGIGLFESSEPFVRYERKKCPEDEESCLSEEGPYEDYHLGIQINDGEKEDDNYQYLSTLANSELISGASRSYYDYGSARLIWGRFVLDNIFGAEVDDLPLTGRVEYWNGAGFVTNTDEDCFNVSEENVNVISTVTPELADSPTEVSLVEGILPDPTQPLSELLRFAAYGSRTEFTFELEVPPYLQYEWDDDESDDEQYKDNPTAEGTFGIYRGSDRQIYWQEVGW
ncbi:DUF6701 domain-containing protein [Idiomarina loihiensis]|uniref:DUF6701 domain-containing protein n=1 Tax=Idiomarina loihiensis TaxID=135577 RepID=UPI0038503931